MSSGFTSGQGTGSSYWDQGYEVAALDQTKPFIYEFFIIAEALGGNMIISEKMSLRVICPGSILLV